MIALLRLISNFTSTVLVFGVGAMIYSAIEIGLFIETSFGQSNESCQNYSATFRPFLQTTFVFVQMYFIFLNLKVNYFSASFCAGQLVLDGFN